MKSAFMGLLIGLLSLNTYAADSTWLICKNIKHGHPHDELVPVISIFEHRNGTFGRKTEIYLVYGAHLLTGSLKNKDEGKIFLKSPLAKDDTFSGKIKIDYFGDKLLLKGDYITFPDSSHRSYDLEITCEEID